MHVVYVKYLWASLHRSDCVIVIVAPQQRPIEEARQSRLRSVTEHHCQLKNPATKKKIAFSALPCTLDLAHSFPPPHIHIHIYPVTTYPETTLFPWRAQ